MEQLIDLEDSSESIEHDLDTLDGHVDALTDVLTAVRTHVMNAGLSKAGVADYLRLLQFKREVKDDGPRVVHAMWVRNDKGL